MTDRYASLEGGSRELSSMARRCGALFLFFSRLESGARVYWGRKGEPHGLAEPN